ncbi:MAG: serine dehydrogenasease [Chloroflexi bacterium]|nr:serine dehydrogenasease [Chloroflexota bacterium]
MPSHSVDSAASRAGRHGQESSALSGAAKSHRLQPRRGGHGGRELKQVPEVNPSPITDSNRAIEQLLGERLQRLEQVLCADVLTYVGPIAFGADTVVRDACERRTNRRQKLAFILETHGGYVETTERIANTLRNAYEEVDFFVPNFAMSAGTVLVMSGDAIWMNYFSTLGPIDPQVLRPESDHLTPATGYLVQYERLVEKSRNGQLSTAELAYLIEKFDPADLYAYEQERELSVSLLKQWLVRYKFKNWKKTETRGKCVTDAMKEERAEEIARSLNNPERWHSHSRGINMEKLREELKLVIEDFDAKCDVRDALKRYYELLVDYLARRGHQGAVHTHSWYRQTV